jgi:general secretion pathway protein F
VREGLPLSAAMAEDPEVFPRLLVESIRASERTSDYGPALTRFIRYQRMASEMRAKAVSAALYPMILLGVSGAVLLFLLGYVVPRFAQVYAEMGDKLPWSSRLLLMVGQAIGARPELTAAAAGLAVLIGLIAWHSQQLKSMGLDLLRRIPNIRRLLTTAEAARMYRTLALLVHGGIALVPALRIVRGLLSGDAAQRLDGAIKAVSEGRPFSESMKDAALSTVIADRFIRVGEQTGRLGDMLDRAAEFHEDDLGRTADRVGRVLGPVMMLVMGAVIGLVVVMMYLPIFQLADAIQ